MVCRHEKKDEEPVMHTLHIKEQGVFAAGGTIVRADGTFDPIHGQRADAGQVRYCDHASVFYQIPEQENGRSVMFLHGYGGSKETWMRTPYAEGFSDMFLEDGYRIYLADQPMYGAASKVSKDAVVSAKPDDLVWFTQFRLGYWPNFQKGTQFPVGEKQVEQFLRMMTASVGQFDRNLVTNAMIAALETSGPSVLVTHSQGGIPGWFIASGSDNVTGIVALEPGTFVFPEAECPAPTPSTSAFAGPAGLPCIPVSEAVFARLIRTPIVIYFGDYIPDEPSAIPVQDHWRVTREHAYRFADCVNHHGGDATVVYLPDEGIHGNSHFLFQERNNREIYEHIRRWMDARNL